MTMGVGIRTVLLVDDEPDIRKLARLCFEAVRPWKVVLAGTAAEALALAAVERPDVILLDVLMPDMDGSALMSALRSRPESADTPIIFMTGVHQKAEVDRLRALGPAGIIDKPFDPMGLADRVQRFYEAGRAGP